MPYSNIDKPSKYFNTILYTGDGTSGRTINVGFKPDFVWYKERVSVDYHTVFDAIRGATKRLFTNATEAEDTNAESLQSFVSNGYTIGNNSGTNGNGDTYVSWCWLGANTTVSNTQGSITSTVSANTTSGFSIVSYTGNGNTAASVGHGLGVTPAMMIIKKRSATHEWTIWHKSLSSSTQSYLQFDTLAAQTSVNTWGNTAPTSSLFYVGPASVTNGSSATFIAYCFAEVKGYSKAFSYTGNGSTDGSFVYCGFRPAWIIIKKSDGSVQNWVIHDSKRSAYNLSQNKLFANLSDAEDTGGTNYNLDILSNGFKLRSSNSDVNSSGGAYIGFAVAENPFVSSKGIPTIAK